MPGGSITNLTQSIKGMFVDGAAEKAILYIYLADISKPVKEKDFFSEIKEVNKFEKDLMKRTKKTMGFTDTMKEVGSSFLDYFTPGAKSQQKVGELDKENKNFLKFTVQYNPATIKLYTVNGKFQEKNNQAGVQSKLQKMDYKGKTKMSFDLIFDDCDNMNAFAFNDIANLNVTSVVNKGMSLLQNGGNTHSVRKRMDAMMSLFANPATQQVIFYWSKMVFRGTVTDIGNRYTMFNPQGNPIRGEMHIELTQDKSIKKMHIDDTYWDAAFKSCFKEPKGGIGEDGLAGVAGAQGVMGKLSNNAFLNI
nr:hypothetical protein [uncultured Butyrivibrio sp.]